MAVTDAAEGGVSPAGDATAPIAPVRTLPPDPHPEPAQGRVPIDACDAHMHLFGPFSSHPLRHTDRFVPVEASFEMYQAMAGQIGLRRAVVVQSAAYGSDHGCLLDAMQRAAGRWRGVALLDDAMTDDQLDALRRAGVVAARLNFVEGGANFDTLDHWKSRLLALDWHVEALMTLDTIQQHRRDIERLGIRVVVDHMGYTRAEQALAHAGLDTFKGLLKDGLCWTKLSGADRIGRRERNCEDVRPLLEGLVEASPKALVWGTDWPHLSRRTMPNDGRLLNLLLQWVDDPVLLHLILLDNPKRLYRM
jgi:2-pyrone-4,6-dicarboxylate lactonase